MIKKLSLIFMFSIILCGIAFATDWTYSNVATDDILYLEDSNLSYDGDWGTYAYVTTSLCGGGSGTIRLDFLVPDTTANIYIKTKIGSVLEGMPLPYVYIYNNTLNSSSQVLGAVGDITNTYYIQIPTADLATDSGNYIVNVTLVGYACDGAMQDRTNFYETIITDTDARCTSPVFPSAYNSSLGYYFGLDYFDLYDCLNPARILTASNVGVGNSFFPEGATTAYITADAMQGQLYALNSYDFTEQQTNCFWANFTQDPMPVGYVFFPYEASSYDTIIILVSDYLMYVSRTGGTCTWTMTDECIGTDSRCANYSYTSQEECTGSNIGNFKMPITPNEWHFYCVSTDNTTISGYVDGVLINSSTGVFSTLTGTGNADLYWGDNGNNNDVIFDELMGFNTMLSESEILDIYNYFVCTPDWTCIGYASCLLNDTQMCNLVNDTNSCGESYTGDYSEFTPQACDYCTPSWACIGHETCVKPDPQVNCNAVNDTNICSESYLGNYSEFSILNCTYPSGGGSWPEEKEAVIAPAPEEKKGTFLSIFGGEGIDIKQMWSDFINWFKSLFGG